MNDDCLKLTIYFGERDRAGGRFSAEALTDLYGRRELQTSLLLRGVEGFGARHLRHSDRLLSLSEDLPLVSVAVDTRERIEALLPEVERLRSGGLVTLERARLLTGPLEPVELREPTKLTVYLGRGEDHRAVVGLLHRHGIAGATALVGVDGTAHGRRERAHFFGRNEAVPVMVISVGDGERIGRVLPALGGLLARPLVTLERIRVCKRDGELLAEPRLPAAEDAWHKLMVYASEQTGLHLELVRALRRAGAAGATSIRGTWGYHGDHAPHGDTLWQLRRRVPIVTVVVDAPERMPEWFGIVDRVTRETGLVTSEPVRRAPLSAAHC